MKFRLICQARANHPWGVYSGTDRIYMLQVKEKDEDSWATVPVVLAEDLSPAEFKALSET